MTIQPELELPADPPAPQPTTARALVELLRRHYLRDDRHPAGIFAPDIQAPGPTLRKADLIWLGCTAAAGSELQGHEIKISRVDLQRELADLTKSDPWQRYCDRWWLVVPHVSIIAGLELPESWGVLLPPSGRRTRGMTVHRKAPRLEPAEQAPALRTLAAWQHWRHRDLTNRLRDAQTHLERAERNFREQALETSQRADPAYGVISQIINQLGGVWMGAIGNWQRAVKVEDVVTALRDLGDTYRRRDDIQRDMDQGRGNLEAAQRRIANALVDMDAAIKERS